MGSCSGKFVYKTPQKNTGDSKASDEASVEQKKPKRKTHKQKIVNDTRISNEAYIEVANSVVQNLAKTEEEVRLIMSSLKKHFIFTKLKQEYKLVMVHHMKTYLLRISDVVFEEGKPGSNFYVVGKGRFEVLINGKQVAILKPGDSFGEMALIHDTPRTATIKSLEKSALWGLDRTTFRKTIELLESVNYEENKNFIFSVPIFETLTDNQKELLLQSFSTLYFNPGTHIIKEGDTGELIYIIKEGNVVCTRNGQEIRRLGKGSYFGEQALIHHELRTATVTSVDNVKCIAISEGKLRKILKSKLQPLIYQNSIRISLEKNQNLKKLTKEQIDQLSNNMKIKVFPDKSVVIAAGAPKSTMWIVLKGGVAKETGDLSYKVFDIINHISIIKDIEGSFDSNYLAQGDTDIAFITKTDFTGLLGGNYGEVTYKNELLKVLQKVQILRCLDKVSLSKVMECMKTVEFDDKTVIVQQNDIGDEFFIVKSGVVEIYKDEECLRTVAKHDYFGERSLIFNDFRSATVVAVGKVVCWKIHRSEFMSLLDEQTKKHFLKRIGLQDSTLAMDELNLVKQIGSGMFGHVFLALHKQKNIAYALKTITRSKIYAFNFQDSIILERRILQQLDHSFIVKLVRTFKDENRIYFLMEYVKGIDLFYVIRKLNLLSEHDTQFYSACLLDVLEHLHEREIVYRDLKPENVVVDEEGYPKLIDFGTAKYVKGRTFTIVGTPHYMAPEIITGNGYSFAVDLWSLGVLIYEFMFGLVPFGEDDDEPYVIYKKIQEHNLEFPGWLNKRSYAKDIINQLLSKNPAKRVNGSYENLKAHSWFAEINWGTIYTRQAKPPYVPDLQNLFDVDENYKQKPIEEIIQQVESQDQLLIPLNKKIIITPGWDKDF